MAEKGSTVSLPGCFGRSDCHDTQQCVWFAAQANLADFIYFELRQLPPFQQVEELL